jgi:hypothetical protein
MPLNDRLQTAGDCHFEAIAASDDTELFEITREKYYQPLFIAVSLVGAYNKLIERKNEQLKIPC